MGAGFTAWGACGTGATRRGHAARTHGRCTGHVGTRSVTHGDNTMPSSRSAHPMPGPASHSLGLGSECESVSKSCFTPFEFARGSCFETDAGGSQRETWNLGLPGPAHPRCRRGCGKLTCLHSGSRSDVFPGEQEQKGKQSHSGSLHSVPQTTRLPPTVSCRSHRRVWDRAPVSEMGGPGHLVPTTGLWSREEQALVASTLLV